MSTGFNLIDEPWIAVQRLDGSPGEVSLRQVFHEAPTIRSLGGDVPTQIFADVRLLLALLYCATEVADRGQWVDLLQSGPPLRQIDAYLDEVHDRFDLFDPVAPFYQVANLRTAKGEVAGLEKVIADVPNGLPYQTTRGGPGLRVIKPAEAARWLVHVHAFDPSGIRSAAVGDLEQKAGKGYPIGPGWAGRLGGILVLGDNLWETLMLNLVPLDQFETANDDDLAPWERPADTEQRTDFSDRGPRGIVHLYTMQSRRVRLVGDISGVTGVVLTQGDKLTPHNRFAFEPMTAWRHSKPQSTRLGATVYMPREHSAERAVWRNTAALLPRTPAGNPPPTMPPVTAIWLNEVSETVGGRRRVGFQALGMVYGSNESTVSEIVNDTMDLSMSLLGRESPRIAALIDDAIHAAEAVVREVGRLAANLARAAGEHGDDAGAGRSAKAIEDGFARVDQPCRRWLAALTGESDREIEMLRWEDQLHALMRDLGQELLDETGPAAIAGRDVNGTFVSAALAELWFSRNLRKILPRAAKTRLVAAGRHPGGER